MDKYTVELALYDFVPVAFTGSGLYFLARMAQQQDARHSWMGFTGGGLVATAGFLKAAWKLKMATSGKDSVWMRESLFPMMGPGFALVASAVWSAIHNKHGKASSPQLWTIPVGAIVMAYALAGYSTFVQGKERGYFPVFLLLASTSNVALSVMLIREALRQDERRTGALFFANIAMVFALQPIAAMEKQSIALHWLEQTLTTAGAAAFAYGAHLMLKAASE